MWLMFTTVFGYTVVLLITMFFIVHFLKKVMIAEDSTTIDAKPEQQYDLNS